MSLRRDISLQRLQAGRLVSPELVLDHMFNDHAAMGMATDWELLEGTLGNL